jgi:hypothetical protein
MPMKKQLFTIIFISLITSISVAQQVPRNLVVVEIGTGTWCQYCPGAAMGADDLIANGYDVAIIENHNGDSYANTYSNARNSYYGVPGFPTAYFDGLNSVVGGSHDQSMFSYYFPKVNQRMAIQSSFTVDVTGTHTCMTDFNAHITLEKVAANSSTNLKLHVVVTESHIAEYWQGMDEVNWVCRLMAPNQNGTVVSFTGGDTQEFDIPFIVDPSWVLEQCEVVVFLQDQSTKEIFQATKLPLLDFTPEYDFDATVKQLFDLPKSSCSGSFTPEVKIRNVGGQTMNSVEIKYQVNNGTLQAYSWAGSLDYLGEEVVSLPTITFTGEEENELLVYTSGPNGNSDECPANDAKTVTIPDATHTPNTVKLILRTDANPGQTTWELKNSAGEVLFQGGPYSTSGQTIQQTFDLADEDCFTFIIYDSGGDGFVTPGFYMLYYGSSTMISQGIGFGSREMVDFNTVDVVGVDENTDDVSVEVFPNPLKDKAVFAVSLEKPAQVSIKVFAVTGQVMMNKNEDVLEAGKHGILIDATSWKPGLYLYQVMAGGKVFSGKLTVK